MGQIHKDDIQVLQGETLTATWTRYTNAHTVTITGLVGGETGTWTLTVSGQTTAALSPTATAAEVAAAVNALPVVNEQGLATVTGTGPWVVTWPGSVSVPDGARDDAVQVTPALSPQRVFSLARVPSDLTGYTAYSDARETQSPTGTLIWTSQGGSPTATFNTLGSDGVVTLTITHTNTQAMTAPGGYYDVHLVSGAGNDERFVEGSVTIKPTTTSR